ncbi:MAG: ester cyclase [Dehalococcoidia bacterium]
MVESEAAHGIELMRSLFAAVEAGDIDFIVSHVARDAARHDLAEAYPGVDGSNVGDFINTLRAGVPDMRLPIHDIFACGDRVAVRFAIEGIHQGELFGAPGSGRPISINGINIYRLQNGLVQETWQLADVAGLMRQVGGVD